MIENLELASKLLPQALLETLVMVFGSAFFGTLIGFPLGVVLFLTKRGGMRENLFLHRLLGIVVNIGRSIPFAILMIAVIPFTRLLVGTSIGTIASIVPLSIAAAPFFARLVETTLGEVGRGVIHAAQVMNAKPVEIVNKVLVPESLPSLILAFSLMLVNLVGYSAMAGLVGGGGLGQVAIQYGYQRFNGFLMLITLVVLLLLVEVIQWTFATISTSIKKKRGIR